VIHCLQQGQGHVKRAKYVAIGKLAWRSLAALVCLLVDDDDGTAASTASTPYLVSHMHAHCA